MPDALFVALTTLTMVGVGGSLVTLVRHWPPSADRRTTREAARAVRRGRLPTGEPARRVAVGLAEGWAHGWWTVLLLAGLAGTQVLLLRSEGWTVVSIPGVAAVLCGMGALSAAEQTFRARRALRGAGTA